MQKKFQVFDKGDYYLIQFEAMASRCEILIASKDSSLVTRMARIATTECWRIEQKFSRYIPNNYFSRLNASNGSPVAIDRETFCLLEYASKLYQMSHGLFDITTGVLRKLWSFNKNNQAQPPIERVEKCLKNIGFEKLDISPASFVMPVGMEIDFGGLGKEYAVDRVASLLGEYLNKLRINFLINFGGDIMAFDFDNLSPDWQIGIESSKSNSGPVTTFGFRQGGIATSGTTKRYFEMVDKNGKTQRFGHILNPRTGFPMLNVPVSVTVYADTCTLAGSFSTLAMLEASNAEAFLNEQEVQHWIIR